MNKPVTYTTSSSVSTDHFNDILKLYLTSSNQVMPELQKLISSDPNMPMAHLLRAYLLKLASDPRLNAEAIKSLETAQLLALNSREKMHAGALTSWFAGDMVAAVNQLEDLLAEYPLDVLAVRVAHHFHFYSGNADAMKSSIQKASTHYQKDEPFYSYVLGMKSFGLEEAGDYAQAEILGREAVAIDPTDQWATHAVAHVMQMQSRFEEGIEWLINAMPHWHQSNNFIFHVHWHQALFELGRDNPDQALKIYDEKLTAPLLDDFYLDVCNAASLLVRLETMGIDVSDRWQALAQFGQRALDTELVFCSLHYLLAPARLKDETQLDLVLKQINKWQQDGSTQGLIMAEVGQPLALAIREYAAGNLVAASEQFTIAMPSLHKIGGSHAQRALFTDMHEWVKTQAA